MEQIENSEQFINWKKSRTEKSSVFARWNPYNIEIPWEETIQTDEVPIGDEWDSYTTDLKYQLARLHQRWNIPRDSVRHFMSMEPELIGGLDSALEPFKSKTYSYNFLKLTPGHMLVWHFDTYATFVRRKDIPQSMWDSIKRSVVMITPWNFGQIIQIGGDILSDWKPGDIYTWNSDTWHGVCNFGNTDLIVMQVTYLEKNETNQR